MKKELLHYYLQRKALEVAIESSKSKTSILSKLEKEYSPVRGILYILGKRNGVISLPSVYESKIYILHDIGLLRCYNNEYCIVTSEGKDLYERFHKEKNTIDDFLRDSYRTNIKSIDMYKITKIGLDSLLEFVSKYGFHKPTGNTDPFIEILFVNKPKSFTLAILGTWYTLLLLMLYKEILSCEINEKCINHYPSRKFIIEKLKKMGIYLPKFPFRTLCKLGLIEKLPYSNKKHKLTQPGRRVAKHIALHAYRASNI